MAMLMALDKLRRSGRIPYDRIAEAEAPDLRVML